jgi:hypothetical protein
MQVNSTMSDLNPKAAIVTAASRQRFYLPLLLALLLIVPFRAGWAQSNLANKSSVLSGQGAVTAQRQQLDYATDPGTEGFDSTIAQRRAKMLNNERHKSLVSDSDKLFKLATELNDEIAHSNSGSLTPDQLRKVAEIEKLAHNVRDKMTQTLPPPSTNLFPVYGPPISQ